MIKELKRVTHLLTNKERYQLIYLIILQFFSGIMDVFGVVSIVPFLAVVSNKKILNENIYVIKIKEAFNLNNEEIIIYFALSSVFILAFNQAIKVFSGWCGAYVSENIWSSLHRKSFKFFLDQPYSYHINTNSNKILEKLNIRVNAAVAGVITPIFTIIGYFFTSMFLFILLIIVNPVVTSTLIIFTGLFYFLIFSILRKKIENYGKFAPEYSAKTFKLTDQALRSIKDIKMKNNSKYYRNSVSLLRQELVRNQINKHFFSIFPRSLLETFSYTFAFGIAIYLIKIDAVFSNTFILLGVYVFSLQKILPATQGIYHQVAEIKYYKPSLDVIYDELFQATNSFKKKFELNNKKNQFTFSNQIELNNVQFKYPSSKNKVLDIKYIDIKEGNFVGITGQTGSGKTTFIDLVLGLLNPTSGNILIDKKDLNENFGNMWRSKIGYVPQFSFMADDTVKNNIALGQSEINTKKIKEVCKIANIADFIEKHLPLKYDTLIGENGVRLSGGQRQRLSIARSLYKDPDIIVLDEATNSLDAITEKNIVESLLNNYKNKTIIMIAHRLPVLKRCNKIFLFHEGKIIDSGTYDFLFKNNLMFKEMLTISQSDKSKML